MPEVADAVRRFGDSYVEGHGAGMLPSHGWPHAGTPALLTAFPPRRNRACPKCHAEQTQAWLEQRREEMLPVPYYHVTVTVPEELRAALRRNQIDGYGALLKAGAE